MMTIIHEISPGKGFCRVFYAALLLVGIGLGCCRDEHKKSRVNGTTVGFIKRNSHLILGDKAKLLLATDSPTTLDSNTVASLRVIGHKHESTYIFSCSSSQGTIRSRLTVVDSVNFTFTRWKTSGRKEIVCSVTIRSRRSHVPNMALSLMNSTFVFVTDSLNVLVSFSQDGQKLIANGSSLMVKPGLVIMTARVHDPSLYFKRGHVTFVWTIKQRNKLFHGQGSELTFNASYIGDVYVTVNANVNMKGKNYRGSMSSTLNLKVIWVKGTLSVWQEGQSSQHIPTGKLEFATGRIFFKVNITHNHPSFASATIVCYWAFGDGNTNTTTTTDVSHVYYTTGLVRASVQVAIFIDSKSYEADIQKIILLKEPVDKIVLNSPPRITAGTKVKLIVNCTGSKPISFCWFINKDNCMLPHDVICSPTLISHHCNTVIHHVFYYPGSYCLNVTSFNAVSSVNAHFDIRVHRSRRGAPAFAALTLVLLLISVVIVVVVITLMVRKSKRSKWRKQKRTEVATFDFRNSVSFEDKKWSASLPPMECQHHCFPWCFSCRRLSNDGPNHEYTALYETSPVEPDTPHRKISYYGAVHMGLLQPHNRGVVSEKQPVLNEEDESFCSKEDDIHGSL